jgi:HSP20 family molecular chaperone IbpA
MVKNDPPPTTHSSKQHYQENPANPPYPTPTPFWGSYKGNWGPNPLSGYRGIDHPGFFPYGMPSFGIPLVIIPAFACMNMFMPGMPQFWGGPGSGYPPGIEDHQGHHHHHHHHDGDRHHHDGDRHHHDGDRQSHRSEEERECRELEKYCMSEKEEERECKEANNNNDDAKSVEDLLEEYLEDIDEKTELIHEILDECEAMDLVVNIHGFELEEIHVSVKGRQITIKGDHQYSEATWVRVRNFSECYEIPEEFDLNRTTATKMGDELCIRIPHVDGE